MSGAQTDAGGFVCGKVVHFSGTFCHVIFYFFIIFFVVVLSLNSGWRAYKDARSSESERGR